MKPNEEGDIRDASYDEIVVDSFRRNPAVAVELLNSILHEGEQAELLIALRQLTKAFGGVSAVAQKAGLNQTQLYRTLSEDGNPALTTLAAILKSMGLRLAVQPIGAKARKASKSAKIAA
jgi:probable addiction module antidote protein